MKEIVIKCYPNGTTSIDNNYILLSNENEVISVRVDFSGVSRHSFNKRVDIYISQDQSIDYYEEAGGTDELVFNLGSEHTKQGYIRFQPIAYDGVLNSGYLTSTREKWSVVKTDIAYSINVSESTTNVDQTLGESLQSQIDEINLTKGITVSATPPSNPSVNDLWLKI